MKKSDRSLLCISFTLATCTQLALASNTGSPTTTPSSLNRIFPSEKILTKMQPRVATQAPPEGKTGKGSFTISDISTSQIGMKNTALAAPIIDLPPLSLKKKIS